MATSESMPTPEKYIAAAIVENGLWASFGVHEDLGAAGVESVQENQFGDTALVADVQSEAVILEELQRSGLSTLVHSEEHGVLALNADSISKRYLSVIDGLDGSSLYKQERGIGAYGTMFSMFENDDPRYDDYLAAGIMLHSAKKLLLAVKGEGLRSIDFETQTKRFVKASDKPLNVDSLIFTDDDVTAPEGSSLYDYFQTNLHTSAEPLRSAGYSTQRTGSSAGYYASLAMGEASLVGEATRKGNLELATAYAIVKEAGGLMLKTADWQDIGPEKFMTFGQNSHEAFVAVANKSVADKARQIIG